jgi:hypothetical protein
VAVGGGIVLGQFLIGELTNLAGFRSTDLWPGVGRGPHYPH